MGYTLERVINFELEANPTLAVLRDWWTSSSIEPKTVPALVKYLKEIGREDAATLLRPYEYQDTIDPLYDPYNPFPVTGQHFAGAYNIPSNLRQHPQENYESSSDSMNDYKQQACAVVDLPPFRDRIQNNGLYSPESHEYLNQPQQGNLQRLNIPQSLDNLSQLNNINGYNNMYNSHQMNNLENSHRMNSVPRHAVIQTSLPVIMDKVALVLGNQAYHHPKLQGLCYSENDAYDVAEALKNMQFKVVSLINLTLEELRTAMLAFCRLLGPGVYGVVYYAGHAYEDNGEQFILPIDANLQYRREESLRAQEILEAMQQCDTLLNLFILDACRVRLPKKGPRFQ